ncbi:hypothetical protein BXZ70DRAFT_988629 [Cristinia sonorae]|uniref:L-arabinokinase n=1 Tax=Cristinia sonorae TaxID=1940300 RepID=A0A8K0XQS0_9AGAR|nr:hypothetical protein BXZ70DRAFT_988629 [Cristinia sonorae]
MSAPDDDVKRVPSFAATKMVFVYYCSGHGYGHATRVSAVASHLLKLPKRQVVHIVSSAPQHVFAGSIALGALYRRADIDPVIVQPVAYRVDRRKSVDVLRSFLELKDRKIAEEKQWLQSIGASCVLSDAAFLGCAAANAAGIPSILITNFTFDSVYSYLSTTSVDQDDDAQQSTDTLLTPSGHVRNDTPIPHSELIPLVQQIIEGYRCADLLLRLPGAIPIPAFSRTPSLPAEKWVDPNTRAFIPSVASHLLDSPQTYQHHDHIPFEDGLRAKPASIPRTAVSAPLVVRSPNPDVYTEEGRKKLLDTLGVPSHLQNPDTKILLVSFGGQVFHKPASRTHSRTPSNTASPHPIEGGTKHQAPDRKQGLGLALGENVGLGIDDSASHAEALSHALKDISPNTPPRTKSSKADPPAQRVAPREDVPLTIPSRKPSLRTRTRVTVAGAPPATISTSPSIPSLDSITFTAFTIPPTPDVSVAEQSAWLESEEEVPQLFPDESWIAVVCGVSKDWGKEDGEELPERFFVAPKDVYMPDLTAVADVLLGKLGYGTVSECVDACTPFVFVPRPLFIEEFGLRLLLNQSGVGVELSRSKYESGEWASAIEEAWSKGKEGKRVKRLEGETGKRREEGRVMAEGIVEWVERWERAVVGA